MAANGVYCSGSVTSSTITVVEDNNLTGLIKQTLTTGSNAWGSPSSPATSGTYASDITSTTVLAASGADGFGPSGNGNTQNGGQTAKILGMTTGDEAANSDKYMQLGFTVASGKKLNVSAIYIPVQPVTSNTNNFKAVLTDGETTITGTATNIPNGKLAYIQFPSYGSVSGDVTLTIYAWGWTQGYRFGKSIVIDGVTESDCDAITAEGGTGTATSITKTGASLPYTLTNTTGVASVTIKVYDSEDNLVETIAGLSAAASGSGSATSLSAGTTYYYTVTPIASSGYCDGEESDPSDEFTTKYGVTYAAGVTLTSGSVPTDANAYDEGDDATVLGNTGSMVYTGYTFRGWTYNGTFYLAGQSIEISGNITLTAAWDNGSGECNTTLVDIDFTNKGSSTSYSAGSTYTLDGTSVYFKSAMSTYSDGTYLNLPGNATTSSNYMAVPLSSINGSITITVTHNSTRPQWKHYLAEKSATPSSSDLSTAPSSMSDCPRPGSNTTTTTWTISNISKSYGVFYVGKGSNGTNQFMGLTITTPCAGSCFTVSFADGNTAPASHTTWPDDIEGVPSGKKILQPADPTADDYVFGGWYIDAACTNAFNFSGTITQDTTLYAKWSALHTVTWMVNGSEYTTGDPTTETEGSITTVPTAPSAITCSDSFRGWSATNLYGEAVATPPADLFVTAADAPTITKDTFFYAIFGDAASASATDFTSTFTSKSWADADSKWNSGKDGYQKNATQGVQVSTSYTGANASTKAEYKAVSKVVVTYSTNASSGAGSIEIKVGGTAITGDKDVTKDGGTTDRTINYTPVSSLDGKVKITVNTTDGSIFIKSVQIYHAGTFENYRCICPTMTVTPKLVTASAPIFITSAASKTVRSQDSLVIVGSGLSKSTAITLSSPASKFELRSRTNGVISTDATGAIDTVAYIYYTPGEGDTSDGLDKNANFTVSVTGNGAKDVTVSQALIGRHVPANFVIAAKSGDNWYALPADMSSTSTPTPVEIIAVDNESDPTTARTPEENVYSLYPPTNNNITSGNGQYIRLGMHGVAKEGSLPAPLFGSATGTYTLGKSGTSVITNDLPSGGWWWKLQQTNTSVTDSKYATYNLYGANNTNSLKIYTGPKWGLYASGVDEIRLIPWLANYRVFFEDGNLTPASHTTWPDNIESVLSGETIDEPTDEPEADGYVFIGWYKEAECTNAWNFATDVITEATTLYAKWTGSDYNITYHLNGASWVNEGEATYTSGVGYTLPVAGDMNNVGYSFNGWYANSDLSTGGVVTSIGISETGDKEFWAKWTENTYTITYNANGGSGSTTATNGHYVTVADNGFTAPDGKSFVEWNTLSTGLGVSYNEGDEIELTADMTLYAIWAKSVGTINWSVTKIDSKLYRGGGGYTITAEINDASWDATAADSSKLELTASDGVVLRNIAKSINASDKAQITANFDITTDVNANATKITFTLNVPENNGYAPLNDDHNENLDNCTGGKVEVRFLSSEKNDAGDNFADMSTSSNTTQLVGDGFAKLIAIGSAGLNDADNKIGYRDDGRLNVVFKLTSTTTLDIYFNANSTSKSFALYSFSSAKTLSEITTSDYSSKTIVSSGVTAAGATFSSKSHTASTGSASVSSGVVSIGSTKGGLKATYSSLSAGYYVFDAASSSNESYVYGFDANAGGGGGSAVTPTLTWDDGDLDIASDGVAKETGDADFTFTASTTSNTLGAITYASSNTSVVTVNATTGKVHVVGAGSATITATLAESGCYEEATASYNITVADNCEDVAGTIGTVDQGCSGIQMTVTGHTAEAGVTYQWYKDGATISGATSDNYTATEPGEYYVEVTNEGEGHCTKASTNTVTLEASEAVTAAKIVNQWYVKNGRRTPDVALVQTENATSFVVKIGDTKIWDSNGSVSDGFGGCPFRLGDDGIIYLNGQTTAGAAPSDLIAGDVTLKITASGCSSTADELSIVIHKQAATTAKSVAFVVDGTKGGAVTAFTEAHATTSPLYVYLDSVGTAASARQFTLTGRNAYWSTVDSTLKAHYSQFDVILITDDPSTQIVPDGVSGKDAYKTKGYINALGCLIDVRPILTMEAFVSALTNWKSKGINGNPTSPNPRQYAMKLDCKDHEIFNGLEEGGNVVPTEEDGTTYWTVTMVDKTKSPYSALATDATDYDGMPALQGFSASDVSSLLLLGEISDGAYYAGVERQEEPAARLMLLGLNAKALPNALTEEGKIIIENALTYLLKTNMEEVDDCSNYFTGATSTDWNTSTNWSKGVVPNSPMVRARILKPCEISGVTAKAAQVDIVTGGTSSKFKGGSGTCTGKLTINPTGALVVGGEIRTAEAPHYNKADLMPTDTNNLVINTNATNQAALIFNNDKGDTKATVNLYSLGRFKDAAYQFQYFAVPMTYLDVNPAFAGAGIYTYVWTEADGWERRAYYKGLEAFEGVGITTTFTTAKTYQMKGTLASTEEREITLTAGGVGSGQNIVGNSWLAPIDIASLRTALDDDASIVDKTIYIYCTGNDTTSGGSVGYDDKETPGQWLAIPIEAVKFAAWDGLKVIPAMQGFCIIANSETTLTLNYEEAVRKRAATMDRDTLTTPLRAPKHEAEAEAIDLIRIRVADSQTHTDLYLFEGETFSEEFDNGWEAKYMSSDGRSAKLYAETAIGQMAVVAQPEYEGTILGFAPGKETEYTFTFSGPTTDYYLNDLKEKKSTLISEGESYLFNFEEGDTNRFYISKTRIDAPTIATGTENTGDGVKARKVLVNDKLYIILNGKVYSAEGMMVK